MSLPTHRDSGTISRRSENTLAEPLKHSLEEHMHKSDSEATPKSSIGECIHSKTFAHSPDRLDLTEASYLDLLRVTEASIPNRIGVSSRQPGNEQPMSRNRGIAPDFAPFFQRSIPCRLPLELLEAIFLIYAQDYRNSTRVPRWGAVSYVCQYWRNVALGCAHLWAYLFFVSPEWIDEQLRRSKTAPLMVHIHLPLKLRDSSLIHSLEKVLKNHQSPFPMLSTTYYFPTSRVALSDGRCKSHKRLARNLPASLSCPLALAFRRFDKFTLKDGDHIALP